MSNTEIRWTEIQMAPEARRAAIEVWNRGSADTTQMLLAVAAAIRVTEQRHATTAEAKLAKIREHAERRRDSAFRIDQRVGHELLAILDEKPQP